MSSDSRVLTLRRASDIEHGRGEPAEAWELAQLKKFQEKQVAPTLKAVGPALRAAAKAYPAAMRVINAAPKAERERLENLPLVVVSRMGHPHRTRPRREGTSPRSRSSRTRQRARSPGRKSDDDPPHHLAEQLALVLAEHGPLPASTLAPAVRRRMADVLDALRSDDRFEQSGRTKATRWALADPIIPAEIVDFRDAVWKARRSGAIEAYEAIELLLEPPPRVLAMLAEVAA